jgi:hypothetical protein
MGTNLGLEPSSPSEMGTFLGVLMARGSNCKARLVSARNAVQKLLFSLTHKPFMFSKSLSSIPYLS